MTFAIGPEHAAAQLAASIAFADDAAGPSEIRLYATTPAPGVDPLATIVLATPCATLAAGVLTLHPADLAGSMVLVSGIPRWARWVRSDEVLVAGGTVTDVDNSGDFTVEGGVTPDGDTSPQLIAGGLVLLGTVTLG